MVYRASYFLASFLYRILFGIRAKGQKLVPQEGGFILASNHVSYLDPPAIGVSCPRKLNYMARHDLFKVPLLGGWLKRVGVFAVKRNSADFAALKKAIRLVQGGEGLLVFPEGRRQSGGVFGAAEAGVGFIALRSKAPVIPVFVKGTDKVLPKGAKFIRFNKIRISFGRPVCFDGNMPYQDVADKIMQEIRLLSVA